MSTEKTATVTANSSSSDDQTIGRFGTFEISRENVVSTSAVSADKAKAWLSSVGR